MNKKVSVISLNVQIISRIGIKIFFLNFFKISAFCGRLAHKEYIRRKRKDPAGQSKFHPICDTCNTKYLERQILKPYWKTQGKLREMVKQREEEFSSLNEKLSRTEMEIKNCDRQVDLLEYFLILFLKN